MIMYKSLKGWLNVPISILSFIKLDGAGDKEYSPPVATKCYLEGKVVKIVNLAGQEVISKLQFYLDGNETIKTTDIIVFNNANLVIQAINPFYDEKGNVDIWVVYTL